MDQPLVNRVANSSLKTINLEDFFPKEAIVPFDIKHYLFMEMIIKEKDFRQAMKAHDWSQYRGQILTVFCSVEAIIPSWAYMLIATYTADIVKDVYMGSKSDYLDYYYTQKIRSMDISAYQNEKVVVKGCSKKPVPTSAYFELTKVLTPIASSIMYGEPCSTVPIYKKKKA